MVRRYEVTGPWMGLAGTLCVIGLLAPRIASGAPARGVARGAAEAALDTLPGVVVACGDFRGGPALDIQAQRLLAGGSIDVGWSPDGSRLCIGTTSGAPARVLPDGTGGAIVAWVDMRSGDADIYAHRFTSAGAVAPGWPADGLVVCAGPGGQQALDACPDGAGGVILVWQDYRSGATGDIYAQRISGQGQLMWAGNGTPVCTQADDQASPVCVADGAGGALVVWQDARDGASRIYGAHVFDQPNGEPPASGLIAASSVQRVPRLVADGAGGAYLVWEDERTGVGTLHALAVDASGIHRGGWPAGGVQLATGVGQQSPFDVVAHAGAGCVVVWCDRGSGNGDIRAQRVNLDGTLAWGQDGVLVSAGPTEEFGPTLVLAESTSVIAAWEDHRNGAGDVYAQRLRADGTLAWGLAGLAVCRMPGEQFGPTLTSDGAGGALATWLDAAREGRASMLRRQPVNAGPVPQLVTTETGPGRAKLVWRSQPGDRRVLRFERRLGSEAWLLIRELIPDANGELSAEDRTVPAGVGASYRLSLPTADGELVFEAVELVIPPSAPLVLAWARADDRGLRVAFTLATNEDAALEILDVQGRRVWRDEIGRHGAGAHEVRLAFAGHSGLYFLRLHQGGQSRTLRAVVIR